MFYKVSILVLLSLVAPSTSETCSDGCQCFQGNTSVICTDLKVFPEFPDNTTEVVILSSLLPAIPANGFYNLALNASVDIRNCHVARINECAFSDFLFSEINIEDTTIAVIESGAFRNLSVFSGLRLEFVTIGTIERQAFAAVYVFPGHKMTFSQVNITTIRSTAFHDFHVDQFDLISAKIDHIQTAAFDKFRIENLNIMDMAVNGLDCGTFVHGLSYHYSINMSVTCDCNIAWIVANKLISQFKAIRCAGPTGLAGQYLGDLNVTQICPSGQFHAKCLLPEISPLDACPEVPEHNISIDGTTPRDVNGSDVMSRGHSIALLTIFLCVQAFSCLTWR